MMNNFKYILFDLDGTITDSGEGITKAVQYALKHFGINVEDINELKKFVGPPLRDSYMKFYNFDEEKATEGIKVFREYYEEKGMFENSLYDGIVDVLKALKKSGKELIVATSKPEVHAKKILEHFNVDKYFTIIAGADFEETRVKKGDVIKYALDNLRNTLNDNEVLNLSQVIMIGDREHDIIGAKENNIKAIGVLYGYGDVVELTQARASYIVSKPEDLLEILL
ncbi:MULTISPECIES: HAD family hydrolase [Clostridium]|uniref:HAD family hydrolase n=1 Tax=Clostridium TaxID=1485 RepID=UPI002584B767|nr:MULTISPECIES: HAD family hydrolase [Clostridium]MDU4849904.1 HAD family hydrolase [Clostridium sp.]